MTSKKNILKNVNRTFLRYAWRLTICAAGVLLTGCSVFPKEEELQKTPIIQAYEQEPFKKVQVKRGELKQFEKIDVVCMNLGETQYKFNVDNQAFKGIYVKLGEQVQPGQLLAELNNSNSSAAQSTQMQLFAETPGTVVFVKSMEENERSIAGQMIVITNSRQGFYLSGYTQYADHFSPGEEMVVRMKGKEYKAKIVTEEDLGLQEQENNEEEAKQKVYFHIEEEEAYLQSGDSGEISLLVESKEDVLYIPKSTVTTVNDKKVVYVEDKNGIRSAKYIETGIETDKYIEVTEGLKEGDSIIRE